MPDILIVDDDRALAEALRLRLAEAGYRAVVACGGNDAIRRFGESRPKLVLLDASMPDMSGFEVCQHIRACDPDNQVNVIFLSGADNPSPDYVRRCAGVAGGDRFIGKPYDWREVVSLVGEMLSRGEEVGV